MVKLFATSAGEADSKNDQLLVKFSKIVCSWLAVLLKSEIIYMYFSKNSNTFYRSLSCSCSSNFHDVQKQLSYSYDCWLDYCLLLHEY